MADSLDLARIQFAANITFHILFPTITIAMAWLLLFFHLRYHRTSDEKWLAAYQFWVKVFALTFALGVVSGITMSFQFGTNWPGFMQTVGNVAGPLLAYEVLTAFFLEATFLGIMLFGAKRVSRRALTLAICMVAFGTTLSAFWIIALNSWLHTPTGFTMIDGKAHATSWLAVIFNPSMPYRLTHMLIASGLTVCFLISGVSSYRWLRGDHAPSVMAALKTAITLAAFLIPIQMVVGDLHGLNTFKYQPAKIAAIEGIWHTERDATLRLFAIPDSTRQTNDYEIGIPKLGSLILTHNWNGEIKGLDTFKGKHPPVAPLFWGFRTMVGVGILMLAVSWTSVWVLWRRDKLPIWLGRILVAMTFSGWLATLAGWYVTEIGRQPYLVYGVLMTADAVSHHPSSMIATTLTLYLVTYAVLIISYIAVIFHLARKAAQAISAEEGMIHSAAAELETPAARL
jgi:cytochrome bd ubiquinol oxidase subunit I